MRIALTTLASRAAARDTMKPSFVSSAWTRGVLGLPSFFLFDSWWLDFLIFGIAGMVACSMSLYPPGMRWTQSLLLFGVTFGW